MNILSVLSRAIKVRKSTDVVSMQSGFTLLEMLVVIAVVGVLAAIAVPRFQNSLQKAQFVEVVNAAGPYKAGVELCIQRTGGTANCNAGSNGVPTAITAAVGNVASLTVVGGTITVKAIPRFDVNNVASTYVLTPAVPNGAVGSVTWDTANGTCVSAGLCD